MAFSQLHDDALYHRKLEGLSNAAFGAWCRLILHSAVAHRNGVILPADLRAVFGPDWKRNARWLELRENKLIDLDNDELFLHDFLDHQMRRTPREDIARARKAAQKKAVEARHEKKHHRGSQSSRFATEFANSTQPDLRTAKTDDLQLANPRAKKEKEIKNHIVEEQLQASRATPIDYQSGTRQIARNLSRYHYQKLLKIIDVPSLAIDDMHRYLQDHPTLDERAIRTRIETYVTANPKQRNHYNAYGPGGNGIDDYEPPEREDPEPQEPEDPKITKQRLNDLITAGHGHKIPESLLREHGLSLEPGGTSRPGSEGEAG